MSEELKPCPFCGGEAEIWRANIEPERPAWIACMGKCSVLVSKEYKSTEEAVAAWNRRADDWRDIESAPRDGTRFMAFERGRDAEQFECWFANEPEPWRGWQDDWDTTPEPTHWKPLGALPTPPEGE